MEYVIVTAQCDNCMTIKNISFDKEEIDQNFRLTWCIKCQEVVIWNQIKTEDE